MTNYTLVILANVEAEDLDSAERILVSGATAMESEGAVMHFEIASTGDPRRVIEAGMRLEDMGLVNDEGED